MAAMPPSRLYSIYTVMQINNAMEAPGRDVYSAMLNGDAVRREESMSHGATELDRPVPLYMQVVRQLRARIASGELAEGDRIPSQREMMQYWRISMQTASKVIGALKTEGLAIPSVGRDTIVAPGAAARIAAAAQGTPRTSAAPARSPDSNVISVTAGKTAATADVAAILGIGAGRHALRRQETHGSDDGTITSLATIWYPPGIAEQAPRLAESQPLPAGSLAYITEAIATPVTRATEDVLAAPADKDTAAALGIAPGSPVLITRTSYHAADGSIIEYRQTTTVPGHPSTRTYILTGN
jgi:DNA-binding GntR family transcriptional regulator